MSHPLNYQPQDKISAYMAAEQSGQFSQEKMDEVTSQKVGRSKMSSGLSAELRAAQKMAKLKGWNLDTCLICGEGIFSKNTRDTAPLCRSHVGLKSAVLQTLAARKAAKLEQADIQKLMTQGTVRKGPFWNPKDPEDKAGKLKNIPKVGWRG